MLRDPTQLLAPAASTDMAINKLDVENESLRKEVNGLSNGHARGRWQCAIVTIVVVNNEGHRSGAVERIPRDDYGAAQLCAALALFASYHATNSIPCDHIILTYNASFVTPSDWKALNAHHVEVRTVELLQQAGSRLTAHTLFEKASSLKLHLAGMLKYNRVVYVDVDTIITGSIHRIVDVPESAQELIAFSAYNSPLHGGILSLRRSVCRGLHQPETRLCGCAFRPRTRLGP